MFYDNSLSSLLNEYKPWKIIDRGYFGGKNYIYVYSQDSMSESKKAKSGKMQNLKNYVRL